MSEFHIKNAKTAQMVGEFVLRDDETKNFIKCKLNDKIEKEILTNNNGRVYLFTINGKIAKIGKSASKGGIKATMNFYENSMSGAPGPNRFIMQLLIKDELEKGNKVGIYLIQVPETYANIPSLSTIINKLVPIDPMVCEDDCKREYKNKIGRYPIWNFQENHKTFPTRYEILYAEYRIKKTKI